MFTLADRRRQNGFATHLHLLVSVSVSASVNSSAYKWNPFFIGVGVGQCEHTINVGKFMVLRIPGFPPPSFQLGLQD